MDKPTDLERLALFQALYKKVGKEVNTSGGDSLRNRVDSYFYEQYLETGAKSYDVNLLGETVGNYSLRFSKPTQQETKVELAVTDYIELAKWLDGVSEAYEINLLKVYVGMDLKAYADWYFEQTGECLPGTQVEQVIIPAQDKQYIGGVLKVDVEKVAHACDAAQLNGVSQLLLGDGYDE